MSHLTGSADETELDFRVLRDIFDNTARAMGFSEHLPPFFGQSVWHFCNRGMDGINYATTFLMINQEALREVWSDPDYPFANKDAAAICPFRAAMISRPSSRNRQRPISAFRSSRSR